MAEADAEMFIDVPERPRDDIEITLPTAERTGDVSLSWADRVENGESHMEHGAQAVYPSHLGVNRMNRLRGLSLRLRQQGFLTNLLQRTFTKFFNRHGLIVVKYGATLREMRFAIQA